jgi:hypothetical protein
MLSLNFGEEGCLVSGMEIPPASKCGIGFAMARATRLPVLVTENMVIVINRIVLVEEWTSNGRWVKRPPTNLYNEKMSIFTVIRYKKNKTNDA